MEIVVAAGPVADLGEGVVGQDVLGLRVDEAHSVLVNGNQEHLGELRLSLLLERKGLCNYVASCNLIDQLVYCPPPPPPPTLVVVAIMHTHDM